MTAVAYRLERARELARATLAHLEANRRRLDDLNVYPVPDGDTGTNLTLTVRAIVEAVKASTADRGETLAAEITRAALLGSRGNSGVILSQIVRGFAGEAGSHDPIDAAVLAQAFRAASDAAYAALRDPVEGTILTVVREMAEEAESVDLAALTPGELLDLVVARGEASVARTPELLDKLRDAGVVDAGGAGLVEIVRGLAAGVAGRPIAQLEEGVETAGVDAIHQELSRYRYCTSFVVVGAGLDAEGLERDLRQLGDSLLVVGDASALKVHVHTDDHEAAIALGARLGDVIEREVADMHEQTREREERLAAVLGAGQLVTAVVAVVPGHGNRDLFESFTGTAVVDGGQSMNPSTAELIAAIEAAPAASVVVLPNNANVILSAEQAATHSAKTVEVVPTQSVPAGIAALTTYLPGLSAADNRTLMTEAIAEVVTAEVTRASRDGELDGIVVSAGQWLGLVDDRAAVAGDDFGSVAEETIELVIAGGREPVLLLLGEDDPGVAEVVARIREQHPGIDLEEHAGGQPHYPLLVLAG